MISFISKTLPNLNMNIPSVENKKKNYANIGKRSIPYRYVQWYTYTS